MTVKQKLACLSYMRKKVLASMSGSNLIFICNVFDIWKINNLNIKDYLDIKSEFPEMYNEIIRVGKEHDSKYCFPAAIIFTDDISKRLKTIDFTGKKHYNILKLKIISTIRQKITKGKY